MRENALHKSNTPLVAGDVFRIAVKSGVVRFYKDGALFYTSTVAPTYTHRW